MLIKRPTILAIISIRSICCVILCYIVSFALIKLVFRTILQHNKFKSVNAVFVICTLQIRIFVAIMFEAAFMMRKTILHIHTLSNIYFLITQITNHIDSAINLHITSSIYIV